MSNALREWRLAAGLTQCEAAAAFGIAVTVTQRDGRTPTRVARTWQRYESGELRTPLHILAACGLDKSDAAR
jgi:transcriptional regulator with XRE-family HTH domain